MDDYSVHSLIESKNEWCSRLMNIMTPLVISGFNSIWKDAFQIAVKNGEKGKYLMTFQNYLSQVPKWSQTIVQAECDRIVNKSGCSYLQDLLTCVHVIQLKALSCVRVGQSQRKIDIDIPSLETFIHNVYINCARKIYTNAYLFETDIPSLQIQKNNRELEMIIRECIVNTVRDSVPTEKILRAYMDEAEEVDVETKEEVVKVDNDEEDDENKHEEVNSKNDEGKVTTTEEKKDIKNDDIISGKENSIDISMNSGVVGASELANTLNIDIDDDAKAKTTVVKKEEDVTEDIEAPRSLKFNDKDEAMTPSGKIETLDAPKTIDRLEQISSENFARRKAEEEEEAEEEEQLNIGGDVMLELDDIVSLEAKF